MVLDDVSLRKIWLNHEKAWLPREPALSHSIPLTFVITGHPTEYRSLEQLKALIRLRDDPDNVEYQEHFISAPLCYVESLKEELVRACTILETIWKRDLYRECAWGLWIGGDHDGRFHSLEAIEETLQYLCHFLKDFPDYKISLDLRFHVSVFEQIEKELKTSQSSLCSEHIWEDLPGQLSVFMRHSPALVELVNKIAATVKYLNPQLEAGWFILSATRSFEDVLRAHYILKALNLEDSWPVCPLFETKESLKEAQHWLFTGDSQNHFMQHSHILIGFSDNNKLQGYLGSQSYLHVLKWKLFFRGRVSLFYGRGGVLARGGGALQDWLPYQPFTPYTKLTVQGGALYQELFLGTWENPQRMIKPDSHLFEFWEEVGDAAESAYRHVVDQPGWLDFFRCLTPYEELSRWKLSARPSRRTVDLSLDSFRAISWVSSWVQTGICLPFWLGVLKGLEHPSCRKIESESFFRFLMRQLWMGLNMVDWEAAFLYEQLLQSDEHWTFLSQIKTEYDALFNLLKEQKIVLSPHQVYVLKTIQSLRSTRLIAHKKQVEILKQMRVEGASSSPDLEQLFRESAGAIASGFGFWG